MNHRSTFLAQFVKAFPQVAGLYGRYKMTNEWSHPLFSVAATKGGSTSLAMTVWVRGIYLLETRLVLHPTTRISPRVNPKYNESKVGRIDM
jgi:hypothetical protein